MNDFYEFLNLRIKSRRKKKLSSPVVISTRIRLARNLDRFIFSTRYSKEQKQEIYEEVKNVLSELSVFDKGINWEMNNLKKLEKKILVERHLISQELSKQKAGSGVYINKKENLSVMINEEDHIRMQNVVDGYFFKKAFTGINKLDNEIEKRLSYAFQLPYGYLTSCPTNVGTGMRASAMLHLPGLVSTNQMDKVVRAIGQLGMIVRGWLGEGSDASGSIFQISNQQTLGEDERTIITRLDAVFQTIIEQEINAREILFEKDRYKLMDKFGRSYGVLNYGRVINSSECMNLLSMMRLAVDMGFLPERTRSIIDRLFIEIQPGHVLAIAGVNEGNNDVRDFLRSNYIARELRKIPEPDEQYGDSPEPDDNRFSEKKVIFKQ